jgi:hypothetical protein
MFEIHKVFLFLHVIESGAKIIETSYSPPTSPQNNVVSMIPNHSVGWKHSPNVHCQWGEGGSSKNRSNYMSVDVSKWKQMFEIDSLIIFARDCSCPWSCINSYELNMLKKLFPIRIRMNSNYSCVCQIFIHSGILLPLVISMCWTTIEHMA